MLDRRFPYLLKFARNDFATYIGHLDWIRLVHVALDRTGFPLVYTEGYHPKAKLKFSPPLPVGLMSDTEIVLIYLRENLDEMTVEYSLQESMPEGMPLNKTKFLHPAPPKNPFQAINGGMYSMSFPMDLDTDTRRAILDVLYGSDLDNPPEIIEKQSPWMVKVLNDDEFIDGDNTIQYVARLASKATFHPVKFASAMREYLDLPHLPTGRRLSFLSIEDDTARKLFDI